MSKSVEHVRGIVLLVQEHRFRLLQPGGEQRLCELAPDVAVGPGDLRRCMAEEAPIEVAVEPASTTRAWSVKKLWRLPLSDAARELRR